MDTPKLEGADLDAAVADLLGDALPDYWRDPDDGTCWARPGREEWKPSERWEQGGPIIERERIEIGPIHLRPNVGTRWWAFKSPGVRIEADTPLVAAMRAFVASRGNQAA